MNGWQRYTPGELDAQYNNRAAVPEHAGIFQRWDEDSRALREQSEHRLDVRYGKEPRQTLDLFLPGCLPAPLHVFIHGGYWQAMDKSLFSFMAAGLLAEGVSVAVLNYRLCPAVGLDQIVEDARQACVSLWRQAPGLRLDREGCQVSGHSAGGHLVAMLMTTDWRRYGRELPPDLVASGISLSGLFDLEPLRHTIVNKALAMDRETARRNSPIHYLPVAGTRLLLAVGSAESAEYHRQNECLKDAWNSSDSELEILDLEGHNHFTIPDELARRDGRLCVLASQMLQR